jgi:hypothetical protein
MSEAAMNGAVVEIPLPASTKALIRFQPGRDFAAPEIEDARVYVLAMPTPELISAYVTALASAGIVNVTREHYREAIMLGLEECLAAGTITAEQHAENWDIFERYCEQELEPWDKKDGPEPRERKVLRAAFNRLEAFIAEVMPYYQDLRGRTVRNHLRQRRIMVRVALRGWERRDGLCVVEGDMATEATVAQIPDVDVLAIAAFWPGAQELTEAQKKTSDSPSPSPTSPSVSPLVDSKARTGRRGKSATPSTELTPVT